MKVTANLMLCQGHARCAEICPEAFTTDDRLGTVILRLHEIPAALEEDVALAVSNCPEGALAVQDE